MTKRVHAFKGFASCHYAEVLNSFNPKLQLKHTAFVIKSKLDKLLTELRVSEFMKTLILVFKDMEGEYETKYNIFYSNSKVEIIINNSDKKNLFE